MDEIKQELSMIGKRGCIRYHREMHVFRNGLLTSSLTLLFVCFPAGAQNQQKTQPQPSDYASGILKWRADRQVKLRADDGWLTVSGLFWLKEGENTFGSAPMNDIVLPPPTFANAGTFVLHQGKVQLHLNEHPKPMRSGPQVRDFGLRLSLNGKPAHDTDLTSDDKLQSGSLTMFIIKRGEKVGIRLKDKNSKARQEFKGLSYYKIDPQLRVVADFVPYDPPKKIPIPTVLGTSVEEPSPGRAEFVLDGKKLTLEPVEEDAETLFFIFKDTTAGAETYGAGRFLYTPKPRDGKVVLDFNRAENPPCAFTPYATCPLPPPQNRLSIPIRAGEKKYGNH